LQRLLDAITAAPAWVTKPRRDTVATNALGRALLAPMLDDPASGGNNARFIFLSPAARIFYPDWAQAEGADAIRTGDASCTRRRRTVRAVAAGGRRGRSGPLQCPRQGQ